MRAPILFIKQARFSGINAQIQKILEREFPENPVVTLDLRKELLARKPHVRLRNYYEAWKIRPPGTPAVREFISEAFFRTSYLTGQIQQWLKGWIERHQTKPLFTLSTQSMFNASTDGMRHFVFTDHTHLANLYYSSFDRSKLLPGVITDGERALYRDAHHVFVMGSHVARSLVEHYQLNESKISVVGGGSNVSQHNGMLDNAGFTNQTVSFVGLEWKRKGGEVLQQAWELLQQRLPDATLHVIGCKPKALPRGAVAHGLVDSAGVGQLIARSSVFVFPTLMEPFGIAPVEASAMGLPVVVSDTGAMRDIVLHEQTGLVTPAGDAHALADALHRLLTSPELCQSFGQRGKHHVEANFTWASVGGKIGGKIRECLEGPEVPARRG